MDGACRTGGDQGGNVPAAVAVLRSVPRPAPAMAADEEAAEIPGLGRRRVEEGRGEETRMVDGIAGSGLGEIRDSLK
nr:unnamed protein product [Digitaria exilis]